MSGNLCITVRFLAPNPIFHGARDGGEPEWPPSPLRLFQAIVDAAASKWRDQQFTENAMPSLEWFQRLGRPDILAPRSQVGTPFRIAVPNNDLDSPARVWAKGSEPTKPHRPIDLKTMKLVWATRLNCNSEEEIAIRYVYPLPNDPCPCLDVLTVAARSITHIGWGIDMAVGDAGIITDEQVSQLPGHRWSPSPMGSNPLRTPKPGTLDDLTRKHTDFLGRVTPEGFRPVPPLRVFDVVRYRRDDEPLQRPYRVFELRDTDGDWFRYPHRRFIHIAGMVRHLAIEAMQKHPPRGASEDWVETYVAGHRKGAKSDTAKKNKNVDDADDDSQLEEIAGGNGHRQLSYLPLPSVGHPHADPGVRRVMIAAPLGDDALLDHVARRLAGQTLEPLADEFGNREPPLLVPIRRDNVSGIYTDPANVWHSFTPVILPGHDDHKPQKTRALIERALFQSGIDQPCEFEWSPYSRFPKSYSAHKYDKNKQPAGYFRPNHLLSQTAVHLALRFNDDRQVPGPIVVGAGRHCGFGLFATIKG